MDDKLKRACEELVVVCNSDELETEYQLIESRVGYYFEEVLRDTVVLLLEVIVGSNPNVTNEDIDMVTGILESQYVNYHTSIMINESFKKSCFDIVKKMIVLITNHYKYCGETSLVGIFCERLEKIIKYTINNFSNPDLVLKEYADVFFDVMKLCNIERIVSTDEIETDSLELSNSSNLIFDDVDNDLNYVSDTAAVNEYRYNKSNIEIKQPVVSKMGATTSVQEYFNAPNALNISEGALISNFNQHHDLVDVNVEITVLQDNMIVDVRKESIRRIEANSNFYYGETYTVDKGKDFKIIVDCDDSEYSQEIIQNQLKVSLLNARVDSEREKTVVSGLIENCSGRTLESVVVYLVLINNGTICGGCNYYIGTLRPQKEVSFVENIDVMIQADTIGYSVDYIK